MKKTLLSLCISVTLLLPSLAGATANGLHQTLDCTSCHASQPVAGQPVDFVTGTQEKLCSQCHTSSGAVTTSSMSLMTVETVQPTTVVNGHSSSGAIPEAMKKHMIQWLTERGLPLPSPVDSPWSYGCLTCHGMHNVKYPMLLKYDMTNGELCQMCHGGTFNYDPLWTQATTRRVLFAPSHSGLLQADGISEVPVPAAPQSGSLVTSTVNFPLAAFSGFHRSRATSDIAYRVGIPGSVFGAKDINPSSHLYWYFGSDMVTWDTTLEANGPYTVSITPYTPSTLVEANSIVFTLVVNNMSLADKICTIEAKIRETAINNEGVRNSLLSKAANACKAAQAGNMVAANGVLEALINQLEAQKGKQVDEEGANALIAFVNSLLVQF